MVYRRKNHKGRIVPQDWVWVIGGVCVETKEFLMCYVSNRTADKLYERLQGLDQSTELYCYRVLARLSRSRPTPTNLVSPDGQPLVELRGPQNRRMHQPGRRLLVRVQALATQTRLLHRKQENARPLHGRVPMATRAQERRSLRSIARGLQEARGC